MTDPVQPLPSGPFDAADMAELSKLVPEGAEPGSPVDGSMPLADGLPPGPPAAPAPSNAPALPAPAPADAPMPPAPPAPAPSPAPTPAPSAPATAATPAPTPAPAGDLRQALRASRHNEKRLRDELDRAQQQLEAAKAGKPIPGTNENPAEITDEELAELEENFPLQAKVAKQNRDLARKVQELEAAKQSPTPEFQPPVYDPRVQMVIDQVPDLVAWQYDPNSQKLFDRAVQYDTALVHDPDWANKPDVERMAEAARRASAALAPAPTPSAAPAAPLRQDPATAIANAPVQGPKGISDFRGGAPANAPAVNFNRMTDDQIMSSLPVED